MCNSKHQKGAIPPQNKSLYRFGMNKKKFAVLALMMIALVVLTSAMFVACNKHDDDNTTDDTTKTIEATKGLLISNGDFKVVDTSVKTYPRTITNWTGGKTYSSGNYKDDVTAGAISLDKALYDANKSSWNDSDDSLYNALVAGGRYGDDDDIKKALMIYMPEASTEDGKTVHGPTAYGYTSSSFTIAKGGYYKLSVDVLTKDIKGSENGTPGARIYVSSNTYAEFEAIDTQGKWVTYSVIIEGSPSSSSTLTVMLALGKYSASYTTGLTTGYAVFDNLTLTKLDSGDEYAQAVVNERTNNENAKTTATATLKVSNGRFDFGTTSLSSSATPNGWSLVTGNSGSSDSAPSSLGYNAIIDVSKFADNYSKYSTTYYTKSEADPDTKSSYVPAGSLEAIANENNDNRIQKLLDGSVGTNVFMLSQQLMTAQGVKSSRSITIEKNKLYALSLNVYTYGVHGAGASIVLSGSDGKDIVIKGISASPSDNVFIGSTKIDSNSYAAGTDQGVTTDGWKTYTFYIQGNQFKDYSYNMTVWLGTEGTSSNTAVEYTNWNSDKTQTTYKANGTFSNGWLFMDELDLKEIAQSDIPSTLVKDANDKQTLDLTEAGMSAYEGLKVDLTTTNMAPFDGMLANTTGTSSQEDIDVLADSNGIPQGWVSNFDLTASTSPLAKGLVSEGVVELEKDALPYDTVDKHAYQIKITADSRYEIETQSFTIEKNKFYRISVWVKTIDVKETSGAYVYLVKKGDTVKDDSALATFSQINTNSAEDGFDPYLNDWCELTTLVKGSEKEDVTVSLKFALGSGDRWSSSTLTSGSMLVANVNGSSISQTVYDGTSTGTYVKTANLASSSSSYTFTNGAFDDYDTTDENLEDGKSLNEQKSAATPSNWTFNDKTLKPNTTESNLVAGVVALNTTDNKSFSHSDQTTAVFPNIDSSVFDSFYGDFYSANTDLASLPGKKAQLLAIGSNNGTTGYAAGFSSNSVTLSANSYYALSVYARTVGNTTFSVYLTGESSVDSESGASAFVETKTASESKWEKYTFYIRTGQSSVSVKLNLWLGQDTTYGTVEGATSELQAENAKSNGTVFFDNVTYNTIDEDVYEKAAASEIANETINKLSFLTDSFDSLSSTVESRKSVATPSGWTGTVSGTTSSKATKSGIVYADRNFYEVETVDGVDYARILGADYTVDSDEATPTDEEIAEAKKESRFEGKSDEEIIATLKEEKVVALKKANWIPVSVLEAKSGKQMLVINNTEKSAYTYTSSTFTLKEASFYEVSVWVKTYGMSNDDDISGANVELYLGSANESDKPFSFTAIKAADTEEWTKYTFVVKTMDDDVTSVTVKLSLGKFTSETVDGTTTVTGITSGYAMFDDVTIKQVDEAAYDKAVADSATDKTLLTRQVSNETSGTSDDEDNGDSETPDKTFNTEALWWMIPTIVLAVLIIVVVIVYVVRKVRKPIAKKKEKKAASPIETPSLDAKHNKYDENKE